MRPLTIRARISLSLLLWTGMVLPVVILSLFYFNSMLSTAQIMAGVDARIARMSENVSIGMLTVRKSEKNYLITGDSSYVAQVKDGIGSLTSIVDGLISDVSIPKEDRQDFLKVKRLLGDYSMTFDSLLTKFPGGDIYKGRIRSKLSEYLTDLDSMVKVARESDVDAERDSVLSEIGVRFRSFELLTPGVGDPEAIRLTSILRDAGDRIYEITKSLAERNWERMEIHREEITGINLKTQRNIISIVILTIFVVAFMIAKVPDIIIRPIHRITNIIMQAESGDLSVYAENVSKDEIGELATFLNRMLKSLRTFDALKTRQIFIARAKLKVAVSNSEEGVLIINSDRTIDVVSKGAMAILGIDLRSVGRGMGEVFGDGGFGKFLNEAIGAKEEIVDRPVVLEKSDGGNKWLEVSAYPVKDSKENLMGIVVLFGEIGA